MAYMLAPCDPKAGTRVAAADGQAASGGRREREPRPFQDSCIANLGVDSDCMLAAQRRGCAPRGRGTVNL